MSKFPKYPKLSKISSDRERCSFCSLSIEDSREIIVCEDCKINIFCSRQCQIDAFRFDTSSECSLSIKESLISIILKYVELVRSSRSLEQFIQLKLKEEKQKQAQIQEQIQAKIQTEKAEKEAKICNK